LEYLHEKHCSHATPPEAASKICEQFSRGFVLELKSIEYLPLDVPLVEEVLDGGCDPAGGPAGELPVLGPEHLYCRVEQTYLLCSAVSEILSLVDSPCQVREEEKSSWKSPWSVRTRVGK